MSILKKTARSPLTFRQPFGASKAVSPPKKAEKTLSPNQPEEKPAKNPDPPSTPTQRRSSRGEAARRTRRQQQESERKAAIRRQPAHTPTKKKTKKARPNRKVATPRSMRVTLPVSAEEKALIVASAEKRGEPVSLMLRKLIFDGQRKGLGRPHPEVVPTRKQTADKRLPEKPRQRRTKRKK